jgi:hypothetical protein
MTMDKSITAGAVRQCRYCGQWGLSTHVCPPREPAFTRPRATPPREPSSGGDILIRLRHALAAPPSDAGPDRLVRTFVCDLLAWDAAVASSERAAFGVGGCSSAWAGVSHVARLGIVGSGCRGTKGAASGASEPDRTVVLDPAGTARYRALRGDALRTADAVIADGQGEESVAVAFGRRQASCSLAQRVGLALAGDAQARQWRGKVAAGDGRGALRGAEVLGDALLLAAARAWWGLAGE